jgi:hypothetical protein
MLPERKELVRIADWLVVSTQEQLSVGGPLINLD